MALHESKDLSRPPQLEPALELELVGMGPFPEWNSLLSPTQEITWENLVLPEEELRVEDIDDELSLSDVLDPSLWEGPVWEDTQEHEKPGELASDTIPSDLPMSSIKSGLPDQNAGLNPYAKRARSLLRAPPAKRSKKSSTTHMDDWAPLKDRILELYVTQKLEISQVIETIQKEYNFFANERQFRARIKQWKADKNVKKREMQTIVRKQQERAILEPQKRELRFYVRNFEVLPTNIERWRKRNNIDSQTLYCPSEVASTLSAVTCLTISSKGCSTASYDNRHSLVKDETSSACLLWGPWTEILTVEHFRQAYDRPTLSETERAPQQAFIPDWPNILVWLNERAATRITESHPIHRNFSTAYTLVSSGNSDLAAITLFEFLKAFQLPKLGLDPSLEGLLLTAFNFLAWILKYQTIKPSTADECAHMPSWPPSWTLTSTFLAEPLARNEARLRLLGLWLIEGPRERCVYLVRRFFQDVFSQLYLNQETLSQRVVSQEILYRDTGPRVWLRKEFWKPLYSAGIIDGYKTYDESCRAYGHFNWLMHETWILVERER